MIEKSGSWLSYDGNRLGQGFENARKFLIDNPAVAKEIHEKIMAHQDELAAAALLRNTPAGAGAGAVEKSAAAEG